MTADAKRRLLIVDDEPEILATLGQYFRGAGYAVETAADVPEALLKLSGGYDVVLSDIRLPGESGIEFLRQAREHNPQMGFFLMTGFPVLETLIAAKQHGAVAYFRKPLDMAAVDARVRAFLGDEVPSVIDGVVLVVGAALRDRLGDRLGRLESVVCDDDEAPFLAALRQQRPRVILADVGSPSTPGLLRACPRRGRDAVCFVLVSDEQAVEAAEDLLFGMGASACVPADAPRDQLEASLRGAVEGFETRRMDTDSPVEEVPPRCEYAQPYRNGYYCLAPGACPYGLFQGGWIVLDGKEHQKCLKRPFLVHTPDLIGFVSIAGRPDSSKCMEYRRCLMAQVRGGKKELIIDALGLTHGHYNLYEVLADVSVELARRHTDSTVSVINLSEALLDEFKRAMPTKGVRLFGPRMVDQPATFARWGTRFD